jgi:hypothetical protein
VTDWKNWGLLSILEGAIEIDVMGHLGLTENLYSYGDIHTSTRMVVGKDFTKNT